MPSACPAGTGQPYTGKSVSSDCSPCIAGMACETLGIVTPTTVCAMGSSCPAGTSLATSFPCRAGTYSDLHNATSRADYRTCAAGQACYSGTGGNQLAAVPCSAGYFCPAGTPDTSTHPCPAGTDSNRTNLDCTICPKGWYCLWGSSTPTLQAPRDSAHRAATVPQAPPPATSPAGSYTASYGLVRALSCPPGNICPTSWYYLTSSVRAGLLLFGWGQACVHPLPCRSLLQRRADQHSHDDIRHGLPGWHAVPCGTHSSSRSC